MASSVYAIEEGGLLKLGNCSGEAHIELGQQAGLSILQNKITGRNYRLKQRCEVTLRIQSDVYCAWIREWRIKMGSGEAVEPEMENGFLQGFHLPDLDEEGWHGTALINDLPVSVAGYSTVLYPGYAWYRTHFDLPEDTNGKPIEIVAGGTDNQDWLHYRYYVNGVLAGEASPQGRWHPSPKIVIKPENPAYSALHFGKDNVLAVQVRGLDRSFPGMKMSDCERYSVGTWLVDQRVSAGPLELEIGDFRLAGHSISAGPDGAEAVLDLVNDDEALALRVRYWIDGDEPALYKQITVTNTGSTDRTLLEMDTARFEVDAEVSDGGLGCPCYIGGDIFCGVRHPSGVTQGQNGKVCLTLYPGKKLVPGGKYEGKAAVFGFGDADCAERTFMEYLRQHGHRKREVLNMMHCYGMHDVASIANPVSLTEEMVLNTLDPLADYQQRGIKFDWYWIDAGWYNPVGDLTDFDPAYFPDGPGKVFQRIEDLGMKTGLWTSPVAGPMAFHEGKGITNSMISEPGAMCLAEGAWSGIFHDALIHHVQKNNVKGFKFDGVNFVCNFPGHQHLPGKYSVEPITDSIIGMMEEVQRECPDVFYMLYWSIRSPWWLLWGDTIYERGVLMEGATPCDAPSALMRQSITVSLDQATHHAWDSIPLECSDSLGVWISEWRWGSYLKKEWWQGGWIMDIARGSLLCQLWGDITMFSEDDIEFLAHIFSWMREHSHLLLGEPVRILGDPWNGEPYGYAYFEGEHGVVFIFNPTFDYHDVVIPLDSRSAVKTIFPMGDENSYLAAGDKLDLHLQPFEVRILQIDPAENASLPDFPPPSEPNITIPLDCRLTQTSIEPLSWDDEHNKPFIRRVLNGRAGMADEGDDFNPAKVLYDERDSRIVHRVLSGSAAIPPISEEASLLIIVRLSRDGIYWHHRGLYNIVKASVTIDGQKLKMSSLPYRWHEQAGMWSWILFRAQITPADYVRSAEIQIETYLPQDLDCEVSLRLFSE